MIKFLTPAIAQRYRGKTCLLRVDLNVEPGAEDATNRVDAILPTIRLLLDYNAKVVLLSHRGRPNVSAKSKVQRVKWSLKPFAWTFSKKLNTPVHFISHASLLEAFGSVRPQHSNILQNVGMLWREAEDRVLIIENLRFFPGEEANDATFARHLAALGDFYVNDAFAVSHRKNASVVAITRFLPSYGGLHLKEELIRLDGVMKNPKHPLVVVVGGAKVGDKLRSLRGILKRTDAVLLGSSVFNEEDIPNLSKLCFPDDIKAHGDLAWDIGPWTMERYRVHIAKANTIVWNGSPGFYEKKGFSNGTRAVWKAILSASRRKPSARIVVGGGETVASLKQLRIAKRIPKNIFISTGGGAMLSYLAGEKLPGVEALK
ncbi:MAG: phosphoglycerate kinase [Candidatus Brennerbacteria bacterium]|nr:phosphoglycerate kinase [Candidatus Brennerbacteria bacterium]